MRPTAISPSRRRCSTARSASSSRATRRTTSSAAARRWQRLPGTRPWRTSPPRSVAAKQAGKVGIVGYCWGGTVVWLAAARVPGLAAAVSYYGGGVPNFMDEQPRCPVMFHFGEKDALDSAREGQGRGGRASGRDLALLSGGARLQLRPARLARRDRRTRGARAHARVLREAPGLSDRPRLSSRKPAMKVTILDDIFDTLRGLPCFRKLAGYEVTVWNDHVEDQDELARRLADTEVLVLIRERTAIRAPLLARLPQAAAHQPAQRLPAHRHRCVHAARRHRVVGSARRHALVRRSRVDVRA